MTAAAAPAIQTFAFNQSRVIADKKQYDSSRYVRYKELLAFTANAILAGTSQNFATLRLQATNWAGGGATNVTFAPYVRIDVSLQCVAADGTLGAALTVASYAVTGAERAGDAVGSLDADIPDGPALLTLVGVDAAGARTPVMVHGVYIDRKGQAKDRAWCWMQTATVDWEVQVQVAQGPVLHKYALARIADLQTTRMLPITRPVGPAFSDARAAKDLVRINIVEGGSNYGINATRLYRTRSGVWHTEGRQDYFYSDLTSEAPRLPLMDGARGVATTPMTTDIEVGRNGKAYGANPWQAWVIDWAGNKRTLYGLRHKYPITWQEACLPGDPGWEDMLDIVGDWDAAIPIRERFAWESWGMAWDARTFAPIDDAAPIPPGETEHPHDGAGPVHFRTDRHGYVLRVQFDGHSHATPAKISRAFAANDPWGIAYADGKLYLAERGLNRISVWSADAPNAYLGDLIADPTAASLGSINQQNRWWVGAGASVCRQHPIVAPESVRILDGFVYWSASAQQEVRRMPIGGGPVEVVCRPYYDGNSHYVYFAISDGSFGPRGTVFTTTWSVVNQGRPQAFLPVAGRDMDGAFSARQVQRIDANGNPVTKPRFDPATGVPVLDANGEQVKDPVMDTVYDALDASGAVTGTYATQGEARAANGTPCTHTSFQAPKPGTSVVNVALWAWNQDGPGIAQGRGPAWTSDGYGTAVGVGRASTTGRPEDPAMGVMFASSADGGLAAFCAADDTLDGPARSTTEQAAFAAQVKRGMQHYRYYHEPVHGIWCKGPDWPLPWGENADCDVFMRTCGYVQPPPTRDDDPPPTDPTEDDPDMDATLQAKIDELTTEINALTNDRDAQLARAVAAEAALAPLQAKLAAGQSAAAATVQALA